MNSTFCGINIDFDDNITINFAINELFSYAKKTNAKISFNKLTIGYTDEFFKKNKIDNLSLKYDGYIIKALEDEIIIASLEPRGTLFAIYSLLEYNGCKFVRAGEIKEKIFFKDNAITFKGEQIFNPDYEIRALTNCINDMSESVYNETLDIVDWCAKNRLNTFFVHESVDAATTECNKLLDEQIHKRGMIYEFGGHGAQNFVDRNLFEKSPELFIEKKGVRQKIGNFCVTNKKAQLLFVEGVKKLMRNNPNISVLHLWFDDVLDGSWCKCSKCKTLSPLAQNKEIISIVSESLKDEFPSLKFDILLYHDTILDVNESCFLPQKCIAYWAPRERCYAHGINDENCMLNNKYSTLLQQTINKYGKENICLFEYYTDFILFSKVKNNLYDVIAKDLQYYYSLGIKKCTMLGFGYYSFWAYEINNYVYAKHLFDTSLDVVKTLHNFLDDVGIGKAFLDYYMLISKFTKKYFAFCGYGFEFCDIRRVTLNDYTNKHLILIKEARDILAQARSKLDTIIISNEIKKYVQYEKNLLDISLAEVDGILIRTELRYKNYIKSGGDINIRKTEDAKKCLIKEIEEIKNIPIEVKGYNGEKVFINNLCRTQIWTVNEFLVQEFGLDIDLDMSKIMEGIYDIER